MSQKLIYKYDFDELNQLLYKGKKVSKEILKKRTKGFLKLLQGKKIYTLVGKDAVSFLEKHSEKTEAESEKVEGRPASTGRVQGKVVILSFRKPKTHSKIIETMESGSILVTEMTRPSLVLACKKAGAIITDEGGMLSHAAIISRELDIPCIVGTQNATKILKNGDFVEVNATEGTVKKI